MPFIPYYTYWVCKTFKECKKKTEHRFTSEIDSILKIKKNVGCHMVDLVQVLPYFSDIKLLTFNYLMFLKDKGYKSIRETQTNALLSTTNDPHIKQIL